MLKQFVDNKHYKFAKEAKDWREAIRMSCEVLELDGTVDESYKEEIIACVEEYGPYIVIVPNVAMPHSQQGAKGVFKTAISFMKLEKPVAFEKDEEGEIKTAQLFFTLASCNPDEHLNNMSKLAELLSDDELLEKLAKATCAEDLLELHNKAV